MPGENHSALEALRLELKLVELGLYQVPTPARPLSVFEDSPCCPRYGADVCPNCALMQFVPPEHRVEAVPCHYIPLTEAGENVDSLYRTGTPKELEDAVRCWLTGMIERAEREQQPAESGTGDALFREAV